MWEFDMIWKIFVSSADQLLSASIFVIEGDAEVFRVVEFGGDEDVELVITQYLERADVFIAKLRRDLDGVALKSSEELAVERDVWIFQIHDEFLCFVIEWNNDGNLPVVDELEFLGDAGELEMKGQSLVASVEAEAV
jgi:hypothetical protein